MDEFIQIYIFFFALFCMKKIAKQNNLIIAEEKLELVLIFLYLLGFLVQNLNINN